MKTTIFQKPLEFKLNLDGESWHQNDTIKCQLDIIDHGQDTKLDDLFCFLGHGNIKKIKSKDLKSLTIIEKIQIHDYKTNFDFSLNSDSPITENSKNIFILIGSSSDPYKIGMLELNIKPIKIITDYIDLFEQFFRFKCKSLTYKNGQLETKITPPDSKDWTKIQTMNLKFKLGEEEKLTTIFSFKLKQISYEDNTTNVKDSKKEIITEMDKEQYLNFGNSLNYNYLRNEITNALNTVKLKPLI